MRDKLDFDALATEILQVLNRHGLTPDMYGVSMSIAKSDFDRVAAEHPGHHPEIIVITTPKWYIQIKRRRDMEDYPPGAIMPPPSNG